MPHIKTKAPETPREENRCPKCMKFTLRQQVSIYADCELACHDLSKKGIRKRDVKILGVGWPTVTIYCTNCNYFER